MQFTANTTKELQKTNNDHTALKSNHDAVQEKLAKTEENLKSTTSVMSKYEKALKSIAHNVENVLPKEE